MDIKAILDILHIILQFHETLLCIGASQAKMQFDLVRRKNVTRCQNLFVHIVTHQSWKYILHDLLSVLCQSDKVGLPLVGICIQYGGQCFLAQAVWSC